GATGARSRRRRGRRRAGRRAGRARRELDRGARPRRRPSGGLRVPRHHLLAADPGSGGTVLTRTSLPTLEFVLRNYTNFNARALRNALVAYWEHIESGGKMFWAMAGAMSSAQLGITLAPAIRAGLVHGMSVTGANLEESLFRLVAHDHYKDFPDYRYFT